MSLSINPFKTTVAAGTFGVESTGYIVGTAQDDPVARFKLSGGILDASETKPMFGGIAISDYVPGAANTPRAELGPVIKRATQIAGATPAAGDLTGFCVFDQEHSMVITAESAVPQAAAGMSVNFYRLGSGARLVLPIASTFGGSLPGLIETKQLSWDFANQELCPLESGTTGANVTAATWAGGQATLTVDADLTAELAAGAPVTVASVNPSGYNGTWVIVSINATTIVVAMASNPGAYVSGGTVAVVATAKVALPVKILDVNVGNSMVPVYDASTGFVNWVRTGSAAVCLI